MLVLPIKKKWFDMILSGEKKEEYREVKPYYTSRLYHIISPNDWFNSDSSSKEIDVLFRNGYSKDSPSFIARTVLSVGTGREEWGAEPDVEYYIFRILSVESAS